MTNLLSANFLRLRKSVLFWGSMALFLALGLYMVLNVFCDAREYDYYVASALDAQLFKYAVFIGILAGTLIPLFFGTEYSDGAIRNKITVGRSRTAIYLANLLTSFAVCVLCSAAYLLGCIALGTPLLGWLTKPPALLLTALAGVLMMTAAFCAIFTCVTMNFSRKSTAVVVCLLGAMLLFALALYLYNRLEAPEFIEGYVMSINGQLVAVQPEPNPQFLRGMEREVYRFVYDLLPTAQSIQYLELSFTEPARLMGMSLAITVLFTAGGIALFRKKDLK